MQEILSETPITERTSVVNPLMQSQLKNIKVTHKVFLRVSLLHSNLWTLKLMEEILLQT
jgi:hypothetical protein